MTPLRESFDDVADWCEQYLEDQKGQEIGMIFGAIIRAYGRLAALPTGPKAEDVKAKAEKLLLDLAKRVIVKQAVVEPPLRILNPMTMRCNMIFDPDGRGLRRD